MPKNKRPAPRKSAKPAAESDHEALAQNLVDLALEITETDPEDLQAAARIPQYEQDLLTLVRRALRRNHDEVLYGAIEAARYTDPECCRYLQEHIEEEAATLRLRDPDADGAELEIDAFMIPLFVSSTGGLTAAEVFQDDAAFEELSDSFRHTGLASADSRVVLVRYLYDLDEVDHIGYSDLQQMLKEAAASMRSKKLVAAPTIEASMRGWHASGFGPDDEAMELRFLLGFSLKHADDPFYKVPKDEAAADAYFEGRMARYRMWAGTIQPLLARSLSSKPADIELNFLYQDLFYGAKGQGVAELGMLATLSEVNSRLDELDLAPERIKAVVAPVDLVDHAALRINLYPLDGGAPLATIDKPLDLAADLETEMEDLCDGLGTIGLDGVLVARGFDAGGQPEGAEAYLSD
ncbi:hypothetical protein ACFQ09_02440 [Massilia norwichensis]|uniref:DUF2863 family protein n=1 Tax=Massilia norwichensis TaxID=1442366 RepID=A0ABT2A4X4_9BURK|nr:hypothetical protein [Massilia norwichensis]MCS0589228.1 hypothetical protein [Massilia norwichensis]